MIPVACHHCRVALTCTVALTKNPTRPLLRWANNKRVSRLCFSSSSDPPYSGEKRKQRRNVSESPTRWSNACDSLQQNEKTIMRSNRQRRKERCEVEGLQRIKNGRSSSLVGFSPYSYRICSGKEMLLSNLDTSGSASHQKSGNQNDTKVMQSLNASALLDPLKYCKGSSSLHSGSRSISGTDAARRLLSGKREFLLAASKLERTPVLLDGHGVPLALFQHCIDMAGALLRHYGPDAVECSFRNNRNCKIPERVRVRRRDATNASLPPPSATNIRGASCDESIADSVADEIDWDYNLTLYLTVMERLANNLGQVFEISSSEGHVPENNDLERHENDTQGSPKWNVEVCQGPYFDFVGLEKTSPFPVVEFVPDHRSRSSGRVLIRLQGQPVTNEEFNSTTCLQQQTPQTVSLVFDACIQNPMQGV